MDSSTQPAADTHSGGHLARAGHHHLFPIKKARIVWSRPKSRRAPFVGNFFPCLASKSHSLDTKVTRIRLVSVQATWERFESTRFWFNTLVSLFITFIKMGDRGMSFVQEKRAVQELFCSSYSSFTFFLLSFLSFTDDGTKLFVGNITFQVTYLEIPFILFLTCFQILCVLFLRKTCNMHQLLINLVFSCYVFLHIYRPERPNWKNCSLPMARS